MADETSQRVANRYLEKEASFLVEAMSNLRSKHTGVEGAVIWISAGEFAGSTSQHGPRVKVVLGTKVTTDGLRDAVSVTVEAAPRVLGSLPGKIESAVVRWVQANNEPLLQHWNGELDAIEVFPRLRKV